MSAKSSNAGAAAEGAISCLRVRISSIVAATQPSWGIGMNAVLPWQVQNKHLPTDLAYLKAVSTQTSDSSKFQNAIIMGRVTWDSMPPKFRPLRNRLNIVVSSSLHSESRSLRARDSTLLNMEQKGVALGAQDPGPIFNKVHHVHNPEHDAYLFELSNASNSELGASAKTKHSESSQAYFRYVPPPPPEVRAHCRKGDEDAGTGERISAVFSKVSCEVADILEWSAEDETDTEAGTAADAHISPHPSNVPIVVRSLQEGIEYVQRHNAYLLSSSLFSSLSSSAAVSASTPLISEAGSKTLTCLCQNRKLIEKIIVLGGSRLFEEALFHPCFDTLHLTRVHQQFPCDAYLSPRTISVLQAHYSEHANDEHSHEEPSTKGDRVDEEAEESSDFRIRFDETVVRDNVKEDGITFSISELKRRSLGR